MNSVIELISRRRKETGDASLGVALEQWIVSAQLRALENEILSNPGALEQVLVPLRRRA
jgi:hypothetical protein